MHLVTATDGERCAQMHSPSSVRWHQQLLLLLAAALLSVVSAQPFELWNNTVLPSAGLELACPETQSVHDPNTPYQLCETLFAL